MKPGHGRLRVNSFSLSAFNPEFSSARGGGRGREKKYPTSGLGAKGRAYRRSLEESENTADS
jgi:hypothetical protein